MPRATKPSFVTELPLKVDSAQDKELETRFQAARQLYNACLGEAMTWIAEKIDAQMQQTIAARAFKASQRVLFGNYKRVWFKLASQFKSVEGKTTKQGLRWKNNQVVWCGLIIQPIIDWANPIIKHGLESPVKYVRLIRRELNGKKRWFVQLVNEGVPYQKPQNFVNTRLVGIDSTFQTSLL